MKVKIISRRVFRIDQKTEIAHLLGKLRKAAEKQEGFISRSSNTSLNDPGDCIVISEWKTADHWAQWMNKKKTKKLQGEIDSLLGEKTFFDVYKQEAF